MLALWRDRSAVSEGSRVRPHADVDRLADGTVRVMLPGPEIAYETVSAALASLDVSPNTPDTRVDIDFARVECLRAPWTPVFAAIVKFAADTHTRFRLVNLKPCVCGMAQLALDDLWAEYVELERGCPRRAA